MNEEIERVIEEPTQPQPIEQPPRVEEYPINRQFLSLVEGKTIYNTGSWWMAVLKLHPIRNGVVTEGTDISIYLWQKRNRTWKRVSKTKINPKHWDKIKEAVEEMIRE